MTRRCPLESGGSVYLCAHPEPVRAGYRFTGWLNASGAEVDTLSAADFFVRSADGQTDWQAPPVTLTPSGSRNKKKSGSRGSLFISACQKNPSFQK